MPVRISLAGLELSLGAPPSPSHITSLVTPPPPLASYPSSGQALTATPPRHHINSLTRRLPRHPHAFERASRALASGDALQLPWLRVWRPGGAASWAPGDPMVIAARVLPGVWLTNVNRIVGVGSGWVAWGTTKGHLLKGEEVLRLDKEEDGVTFRLRSFSKPDTVWAKLMYPMVLRMQGAFAKGVAERMESIVKQAKE